MVNWCCVAKGAHKVHDVRVTGALALLGKDNCLIVTHKFLPVFPAIGVPMSKLLPQWQTALSIGRQAWKNQPPWQ